MSFLILFKVVFEIPSRQPNEDVQNTKASVNLEHRRKVWAGNKGARQGNAGLPSIFKDTVEVLDQTISWPKPIELCRRTVRGRKRYERSGRGNLGRHGER